MTNYLEVTNLSKFFDSFQLHNISFTLPKGYIMGLIGPNGSGKTTTIKLILNMLKRTGGTVKVMGGIISQKNKKQNQSWALFSIQIISVMIGKCRRLKNPFRYFIQIGTARNLQICYGNFTLLKMASIVFCSPPISQVIWSVQPIILPTSVMASCTLLAAKMIL